MLEELSESFFCPVVKVMRTTTYKAEQLTLVFTVRKMEAWEIEHITKNLKQLIEWTIFNSLVKAELVAKDILCQADLKKLDAVEKQDGDYEARRQFYEMLTTRKFAFRILYEILVEVNQNGASTLLVRDPDEYFDMPLTYWGISTVLKSFQDVDIEVNGKMFKLREFFPSLDYNKLQQVFQDCLTEVEIYETFATKERTFVLASDSVPPKPSHYVSRFISNRIKLNECIFKADCSDVFVFKNTIKRSELSEIAHPNSTAESSSQLKFITSRFIYLVEYKHWIDLKKVAKEPIHFINYEKDGKLFILEDTSAPSETLTEFLSKKERVYSSEDEFVEKQLSDNSGAASICICDAPGMGKTFLLENIARLMTEKCRGRIIVFIPLTTFSTQFSMLNSEWDNNTAILNVLKYVCTSQQNENLLIKLLQAKLLQVDIFFDGFDEVLTDQVELVKQVFLSISTNFRNVRMYITSRRHKRQELEQSLGLLAFDILPFTHQNQMDFLIQFWSSKEPEVNLTSLQNYATSCLKAVNKSLTKNEKEITGIPLLCELIADVYAEEAVSHTINMRIHITFSLSEMYQKFIERKVKLIAKNKEELDDILLVLSWHALKLLFPQKRFHEDGQFQNVKELHSSLSILSVRILQTRLNSTLEFIHRTFAEYLVAIFFSNKLQQKSTSNGDTFEILELLLKCQKQRRTYDFVHPVVASFLDTDLKKSNIFTEQKIQIAIYIASILHQELVDVMCACCQHELLRILSLLKDALKTCDNSSVLECFTNAAAHELLSACIRSSTSETFKYCIKLLTEDVQIDITQIAAFRDKEDNTLLHIAAFCGEYEAVEYLEDKVPLKDKRVLENCVEFSYHDDHLKIERKEQILELLLMRNPTLLDDHPDILAWYGMHLKLIKILVRLGANLFAVNYHGQNCPMKTIVHMSPADFHHLVQFLLEDCKAGNLFLDHEKWKDPLSFILERTALLSDTLDVLFNFFGKEYLTNLKDRKGESLLFAAAKGNRVNNLKQLVNRGLDYNARGIESRSLLHVAAKYAKLDNLKYLISLKSGSKFINSCTQNKWTPLHFAARYPQLSVVQCLVVNEANVKAKNSDGKTALLLASEYSNTDVIKYLIGKGAKLNGRDKEGNTALHLCWKEGVVECLIELGADINARNYKGQTALHSAALSSKTNCEVLKILIEKGASVNDRDKNGNTPLQLCKRGYVKDFLVEMGADANAKINTSQTASEFWKSDCSLL